MTGGVWQEYNAWEKRWGASAGPGGPAADGEPPGLIFRMCLKYSETTLQWRKGGEKMFRIGEFSRLTQVSIRMLRYYDQVGLLTPAVVDRWTGHRFYSVEQLSRLQKILYFRDSGLTVGEISLALATDRQSLLAQLEKKRMEIEAAIRNEREKLRKIRLARRSLLEEEGELHYRISVKSIPAFRVISVRKVVPTYYSEGELWQELSMFAASRNVHISGEPFTLYHDRLFREKNVDIELCAPVETTGNDQPPFSFRRTEPVPHMACTMVSGGFSNIKGAYLAFANWLQEHGECKMSNPVRQIVHRGPWNEDNPNRYLVELQIPLIRAKPFLCETDLKQ